MIELGQVGNFVTASISSNYRRNPKHVIVRIQQPQVGEVVVDALRERNDVVEVAAAMRQRQQPQRPQLRSTARLEGERTAVPLWRLS